MRKFSLLMLTLVLLVTAPIIQARQLSPSQALERAMAASYSRATGADDFTLSYTVDVPSTSTPGVYVFTRPGGGFVMVSADDAAEALLGYSDTAVFSPEAISPSQKAWIQEYASQVSWAAAHPTTPTRASESRPVRAAIKPLLTTQWNQTTPYNNLCPKVKNSSGASVTAPTGCVATASAQVMRYHKYPAKGTGSISYDYSTPYDGKKTNSMDFSSVTFDWANMSDTYTDGSYTNAQATAVATLMKAVGAAAQMQYGPNESGASTIEQWISLYTYFGYSKSAAYNDRSWYGLYDWEDLIYNSLKNDGPALLGGQSGTGGHAFVCDGYQSDGFFHINWGWGSMSDGYFLLTALTPASQGTGGSQGGYNFEQNAITGIRPSSATNDVVNYQMVARDINVEAGNNRQLKIKYAWLNYSSATLNNVKIGVRINGKDYWINTDISSMTPAQGLTFNNLVDINLTGLEAGTYKAYPVYKCDEVPNGALMKTDITTEPYIDLTIDASGNVKASLPKTDIKVSDFKFDTQFYIGQQFSFSASITNNGATEYIGSVSAIIIPSGSSQATIVSQLAVNIEAGDSQSVTFTGTVPNLTAGTYQLYLANVTDNGAITLLSEPQNITLIKGATPVLSVKNISVANASAVDPGDIQVTFTVTNVGGPFSGSLKVYIFPYIPGTSVSSVGSFNTPLIQVPANSNSGVSFTVSGTFEQGEPGKTYALAFYSGSTQLSDPDGRFTLSSTSGIDSVDADAPMEVTAIYNINGQLLPTTDPSSLTPGLYILVTPQGPVKYLAK